MTAAGAPAAPQSRARSLAAVVGAGVLGPVGAIAGGLWLETGYGVAGRWGWTSPDPTLFDDGLVPWVLMALAATAVDLLLLVLLDALVGRSVGPRRGCRVTAGGGHLLVAAALALAYLGSS